MKIGDKVYYHGTIAAEVIEVRGYRVRLKGDGLDSTFWYDQMCVSEEVL